MFEEQNQKQGVEDIFSATDKASPPVGGAGGGVTPPGPPSALAQGKLQPVAPGDSLLPPEQISSPGAKSFPVKKAIALAAVSLVLVAIGGGAWWWWQSRPEPVTTPPQGSPQDVPSAEGKGVGAPAEPAPAEQESGNILERAQERAVERALNPLEQGQTQTPPSSDGASAADTDGDGLNDAEELTLNTNARLVDTDGDGLSDWEEVKIFLTDPLKTDTDGDTYSDGMEVQNGYNPRGTGKLLDFQAAKDNVN